MRAPLTVVRQLLRQRVFPRLERLLRPRLLEREKEWARAAMESIFAEDAHSALEPIAKPNAHAFLDAYHGEIPLRSSLGLRAMYWAIGLAPIFTRRQLKTLDQLPA